MKYTAKVSQVSFKKWHQIIESLVTQFRLLRLRLQRRNVKRVISYSQADEDLIIHYLFRSFNMKDLTYFDIGANHPDFINNTYLFYQMGNAGICVEPNPILHKKLQAIRPRDKNLNIGVGIDDAIEGEFYLFSGYADGLSTFSKEDAEHWVNVGMDGIGKISYKGTINIPLVNINKLIADTFIPDFLSIDVEGLDFLILNSLDFERYPIKCICVETLRYNNQRNSYRDKILINFIVDKGFFIYADTGINTIFVNTQWFNTCCVGLIGKDTLL